TVLEVGRPELLGRMRPGGIPARPQRRGRPVVHVLADVPVAEPRAVHLDLTGQPGLGQPAAEDGLGRRRAADVARADEADAVRHPATIGAGPVSRRPPAAPPRCGCGRPASPSLSAPAPPPPPGSARVGRRSEASRAPRRPARAPPVRTPAAPPAAEVGGGCPAPPGPSAPGRAAWSGRFRPPPP